MFSFTCILNPSILNESAHCEDSLLKRFLINHKLFYVISLKMNEKSAQVTPRPKDSYGFLFWHVYPRVFWFFWLIKRWRKRCGYQNKFLGRFFWCKSDLSTKEIFFQTPKSTPTTGTSDAVLPVWVQVIYTREILPLLYMNRQL